MFMLKSEGISQEKEVEVWVEGPEREQTGNLKVKEVEG